MTKKEQKKRLLSILYTSKGISTRLGDELPFSHMAIHFLQVDGTYSEIKKELRSRYKGITEREVLSESFDTKKEKVIELISRLKSELLLSVPYSSDKDKEIQISFKLNGSKERRSVLNKFYSQCQKEPGEKVSIKIIPEEFVPKAENIILKLGKAALKKEILIETEGEAVLNGVYKGIEEFETVPKACRRYTTEIHGDFDLESKADLKELKKWIRECVIIIENEEEVLEDWYKINQRINSWVSHEKSKPNN